jgi:transcriptional regulator with XRE-family HTH domain
MSKSPNDTDVWVGMRVRVRRKELGLSQSSLGEKVGITFQQIQKYEKGTNRIGAGRLQAMANALGVSVSYFFPDAAEEACSPDTRGVLNTPGGLDLLKHFTDLSDASVRGALCTLVKALAKAETRGRARPAIRN